MKIDISLITLVLGLVLTCFSIINILKTWKEKQNERIRNLVPSMTGCFMKHEGKICFGLGQNILFA